MPGGNITADGDLFEFTSNWDGGNWSSELHLSGTFGGGTVQIYKKAQSPTTGPSDDGWLPITGGAYTEADDDIINASGKRTYKGVLSGATSPDIDWDIV